MVMMIISMVAVLISIGLLVMFACDFICCYC